MLFIKAVLVGCILRSAGYIEYYDISTAILEITNVGLKRVKETVVFNRQLAWIDLQGVPLIMTDQIIMSEKRNALINTYQQQKQLQHQEIIRWKLHNQDLTEDVKGVIVQLLADLTVPHYFDTASLI